MAVFENFRLLKQNMQSQGWIIEAFAFKYKKTDYVVLVKLYQKNESKPEYALLKAEFIKLNQNEESLIIPLNINGFIIDAKILREFFDIEYSKNLGNILQQFTKYFSNFTPIEINVSKSELLKRYILNSLSESDSEDPNKEYCFGLKRNPKNEFRTFYNDNKTRILRPTLYDKFANESTISFCYSKNLINEKSDKEIIYNFGKRI